MRLSEIIAKLQEAYDTHGDAIEVKIEGEVNIPYEGEIYLEHLINYSVHKVSIDAKEGTVVLEVSE